MHWICKWWVSGNEKIYFITALQGGKFLKKGTYLTKSDITEWLRLWRYWGILKLAIKTFIATIWWRETNYNMPHLLCWECITVTCSRCKSCICKCTLFKSSALVSINWQATWFINADKCLSHSVTDKEDFNSHLRHFLHVQLLRATQVFERNPLMKNSPSLHWCRIPDNSKLALL